MQPLLAARARALLLSASLLAVVAPGACGTASEAEAALVPLELAPLQNGGAASDLGFTVQLSSARLNVADILLMQSEGTTTVASVVRAMGAWVIPVAHAHPGHGEGGTVVGELLGRRVLGLSDANAPRPVGDADAVVANVDSLSFVLSVTTDDDVDAGDPLLGHAALLAGVASDGERDVYFEARITLNEDTAVAGAPLLPSAIQLSEGANDALALTLSVEDPFEGDTLFDGVDFAGLADETNTGDSPEDPLLILPGSDDHNRLRRGLTSHDHYTVIAP